MKRPSGHDISDKFGKNNGASIPPNLIALANTESNGYYLRYCKQKGLKPNPARFPAGIPEFFVRMLTNPDDLVVDPFAGSCVTGEVCERLGRKWICIELVEDYLKGALGRFQRAPRAAQYDLLKGEASESGYYKIPRPGLLWNGSQEEPLPPDGGVARDLKPKTA